MVGTEEREDVKRQHQREEKQTEPKHIEPRSLRLIRLMPSKSRSIGMRQTPNIVQIKGGQQLIKCLRPIIGPGRGGVTPPMVFVRIDHGVKIATKTKGKNDLALGRLVGTVHITNLKGVDWRVNCAHRNWPCWSVAQENRSRVDLKSMATPQLRLVPGDDTQAFEVFNSPAS